MNKLQDKLAFVTGASSGIGKAVSEQLAENGVNLIITARRKDRIESLAKDLEKRYGVNVLPLTINCVFAHAIWNQQDHH